MRTWNDYKEHVKATSPQGKADIEEMEAIQMMKMLLLIGLKKTIFDRFQFVRVLHL